MKSIFTLSLILVFGLSIFAQNNDKKLALVIGNADYQHGGSLKNPVNDANLVAKTLTSLGFEVILKKDAGLKTMQLATAEFTNKITDYDVALFFYAGHGIQVDGENYLIPVDANLNDKVMAQFEAFNINFINRAFQGNHKNMNIMILDACRNNPFRSWMRGGGRGFKVVSDQAAGTIIAFATREGETASDGAGDNGLFTEKLVIQMNKSQNITEVFQNTRIEVLKASRNSQCPQEWNMLTGNFYFKDPAKNVAYNVIPQLITYGSLQFNTEIQGAFYLDGKFMVDLTPNWEGKLENLKTGKHTIEIKGKENWKKQITIVGNQTIFVKAKTAKKTIIKVQSAKTVSKNQFKDYRDNKVYKTVKIGDQVWMAENLSYSTGGSWSCNNNEENDELYGKLYDWKDANEACPPGWHLPSDDEWKQLEIELGMGQNAVGKTSYRGDIAKKIKSTSSWYKQNNGTNESGLNVLPGGFRNHSGKGSFSQFGKESFYWSSTEKGSNNAWRRTFHFLKEGISRMNFNGKYAYSVRCIKD